MIYEVNLSKKGRSTSNHLDTIHFLNEMHIANIHSFFFSQVNFMRNALKFYASYVTLN